MDRNSVVALLLRKTTEVGSARAWAKAHGISPQFVSNVLAGSSPPGPSVLKALGIERVVSYRQRQE